MIRKNRAQGIILAVAAVALLAIPVVAQIQFADVPEDHRRLADINSVAEQRLFVGYGDGTFKPDRNISPSQMTRVLTRAFNQGITRAEFASFIIGGNWWLEGRNDQSYPLYWKPRGHRNDIMIVGPPPDGNIQENRYGIVDGITYILPGRYLLDNDADNDGLESAGRDDCRWMRLNRIPVGGLNFDTIAATDAVLVGHFQGDYTSEDMIIVIEPTDRVFAIDCS